MPTVTIEISDQLREDLIVAALEGGSNYWYFIDKDGKNIINPYINAETPFSVAFWRAIKDGKSIPVYDKETIEDWEYDNEGEKELLGDVNLESIAKGEQLMADGYMNHFRNIMGENTDWDAATADVWFQLCVMGELVYG